MLHTLFFGLKKYFVIYYFNCFKYRVTTLPGNLEKPGTWQFRQKKNLEKPGTLTIFTCLVVKFWFDSKNMS